MPDVPGAAVAEIVAGAFDDRKKLARFARAVDVVTFDWENVPVASARAIAAMRPGLAAAARARSRAGPLVREAAVSPARHSRRAVRGRRFTRADLARAIAALGTPGILKTRRLGYDGKGQARCAAPRDAARAWRAARAASRSSTSAS